MRRWFGQLLTILLLLLGLIGTVAAVPGLDFAHDQNSALAQTNPAAAHDTIGCDASMPIHATLNHAVPHTPRPPRSFEPTLSLLSLLLPQPQRPLPTPLPDNVYPSTATAPHRLVRSTILLV